MMNKYNVLIVDDELLARTLLTDYVGKIPQLNLVAACPNVVEAMSQMTGQSVDIILTDIEMPDITGIDFVRSLKSSPAIIFTTAYSEYAIEGFDLSVVDYLLKPIPFSRFVQAINKAIEYIDIHSKPSTILNGDASTDQKDYIFIKADYKIYKVNFDDLLYIEGQSEYVTFHTVNRNITAYYALKNLELELPESHFVRVHKSYIVSIKHIDYVETNNLVIAGNKIPIGGNYRDLVYKLFK